MKGVLFLCVANSARSQMAEGLAREIVGGTINVHSAGSSPSVINPLAVKALAEVGIDATKQFSKSIDDIPRGEVDTVITLCAEEVCPVYLHANTRHHWPLTDPAGVTGSDEERLQSFRNVRDELQQRLRAFFQEQGSAK
jgi:arsenate reductase